MTQIISLLGKLVDEATAAKERLKQIEDKQTMLVALLRDCMENDAAEQKAAVIASHTASLLATAPGY